MFLRLSAILMGALLPLQFASARTLAGSEWRPPGRTPLPDFATRERVWRVWAEISEPDPRVRYYQLHQTFCGLSIEVLADVISEFEKDL